MLALRQVADMQVLDLNTEFEQLFARADDIRVERAAPVASDPFARRDFDRKLGSEIQFDQEIHTPGIRVIPKGLEPFYEARLFKCRVFTIAFSCVTPSPAICQ